MKTITALYCRADSIYHTLPGVETYDATRDARQWPGGTPCIAHPPCRAWGKLRTFANLPPIPLDISQPTHVVSSSKRADYRPEISKSDRERTPHDFAEWLVKAARLIRPD